MNEPLHEPLHQRKGSLPGTVKAILWGFLGVRRQTDYKQDIARLNPLHVIAVGLVMGILFVLALILIVNWVAG